ncbi:MAG: radical SAM protein [Firmicutes bacterium]|nr:radical SAM protein [Bacillota bacterium]
MESVRLNNFTITLEKQFPKDIIKASFPLRYGKHSVIRTPEYEFLFNLNGEIKFIRGLNLKSWPHLTEQLKRTGGNDWVFYSVGDDSSDKGVINWMGEYYLPCLPYPSNSVWEISYFSNPNAMNALAALSQLYANLFGVCKDGLSPALRGFIDLVVDNDEGVLHEKSKKLFSIIGGRVSVLPPDTRHVDYEVIPLMIADGCLYNCKFCCVKTGRQFKARLKSDIMEQIKQLKDFYGRNLENYNALFLGNHDALAAGEELISMAAAESFAAFGFDHSASRVPKLFIFGSVDSLLKSGSGLFEKLNSLPFYTYINIGLESVDAPTLSYIHKPVDTSKVRDAFQKMLDINSAYANIEITANFLLGEPLSTDHYQSLAKLLRDVPADSRSKGVIYLSPLMESPKKRELLPKFLEIKKQSRLPVYIYLIQRL